MVKKYPTLNSILLAAECEEETYLSFFKFGRRFENRNSEVGAHYIGQEPPSQRVESFAGEFTLALPSNLEPTINAGGSESFKYTARAARSVEDRQGRGIRASVMVPRFFNVVPSHAYPGIDKNERPDSSRLLCPPA